MPHELPKAYDPSAIEARWAEYWVREKLFHVATPPPAWRRPEGWATRQYRPPSPVVTADAELRRQITELGMRESMRRTRLSQHTIEAILNSRVRRATLERARAAVNK